MRILSGLLFIMLLGAAACKGVRSTAAAQESVCPAAGVPAVHFYTAKGQPSTPAGTSLPKKFTAYSVSQTEWSAFAYKVKERGPKEVTGLNIPLPGGCKAFSVTVSGTMSPELAAKYPELASLKGSAPDGSDLRLDWDGTRMRGQIITGGDTYFLESQASSGQTLYLLYHKNDASATKQPFE